MFLKNKPEYIKSIMESFESLESVVSSPVSVSQVGPCICVNSR